MRYRYEISFFDVDYARVLFFGRYYDFVQRANDAWMHQHELYYQQLFAEQVGTPIATSFCRYLGPVYVEETIEVTLGVKDASPRGFLLVFEITKPADGGRVAWGYIKRRFVNAERKAANAPPYVVAAYEAMAAESRAFVADVWEPLWQRERASLRNG